VLKGGGGEVLAECARMTLDVGMHRCASSHSRPFFQKKRKNNGLTQQVSKHQTERQPHKNIAAGRVKTWTSPRLSCHGRSKSAGDVSSSLPLKDVLIIQQRDGPRKKDERLQKNTGRSKKRIVSIL